MIYKNNNARGHLKEEIKFCNSESHNPQEMRNIDSLCNNQVY